MEMDVLMKFYCNMCGNCCRNVERWKSNASKLSAVLGVPLSFPFSPVNGVCPYLNEYNKCNIYESRPDVCRTNYIYDLLKKKYNLKQSDFIKLMQVSCEINNRTL